MRVIASLPYINHCKVKVPLVCLIFSYIDLLNAILHVCDKAMANAMCIPKQVAYILNFHALFSNMHG